MSVERGPVPARLHLQYKEDDAHASGDQGFVLLAVRKDTAAALAGADGDYIPLVVDANGRLHAASALYGKVTNPGDTAVEMETLTGAGSANGARLKVAALLGALSGSTIYPVNMLTGTDGSPGALGGAVVVPYAQQFNGTTWDRVRGAMAATLLASAARTASTNSADQTNYNHRGLMLIVSVTARAVATTLTPVLQIKDSISGSYMTVWTAAAPINSASGVFGYLFYPGAPAAGSWTERVETIPMSRTWRLGMTHSDANSITYSASAELLV